MWSKFNRNAGIDIQTTVGDGPTTLATANLKVVRSLLQNSQLSETDDGVLASGIRLNADQGLLNATIDSTVILGNTIVLNSAFDRMEAVYAIADGSGRINTTISGTDLNALTRTGNDFINWHVGVGSNAEDLGISIVDISDTLLDAECVLKFHAGEFGDPAVSALSTTVRRSELVARLPENSPFDGIRTEALGGSDMSLSILDSEYRFQGTVSGSNPARSWLNGDVSDSADLTLLIENGMPRNSMAGFTNFIDLASEDSGTITTTIRNTTIGDTIGQGIDIGAFDTSRVTLEVIGSTLSNSGAGLLNVLVNDQAVASSTLTSNTLINPANRAITLLGKATNATDNARVGATLTSNQFQALSGALRATSDTDDGLAELRLNMTNNTSNGLYLLEQLEAPPGTAIITLFDGGGNSPTQTTSGMIGTATTALDITFP